MGLVTTPAAEAPTSTCSAPAYRQFDFWSGAWTVTEKDAPAGTNRIERILGGCALLESWTGTSGSHGHSLNAYDAARNRWHQTWVDDHGTVLHLDGGLRNGAMVLEGDRPDPAGGVARDRITWTPRADGAVRQHWEASKDGGRTWTTVFDGLYRRAR